MADKEAVKSSAKDAKAGEAAKTIKEAKIADAAKVTKEEKPSTAPTLTVPTETQTATSAQDKGRSRSTSPTVLPSQLIIKARAQVGRLKSLGHTQNAAAFSRTLDLTRRSATARGSG